MYANSNISELITEAETYVIHDRALYTMYFEIIEEYCAKHSMIIGGTVGRDMLLGVPKHKSTFMYELYTRFAYSNAKGLAEQLAAVHNPHIPSRTTQLKTDVYNAELTISIYARVLVKIFVCDMRVHTIPVTGYFAKIGDKYITLNCLNTESYLSDMYHKLYSPERVGDWRELLQLSRKLYNNTVSGSSDIIENSDIAESSDIIESNDIIENSDLSIYLPIFEGGNENNTTLFLRKATNYILIGTHAASTLGITNNSKLERLHIIHNDIDELMCSIKKVFRGKLIYKNHKLLLPNDWQCTKHTIYLVQNNQYIVIADVFNATRYELVPYLETTYNKQPIRCGTLWVILRFLYIELWTTQFIKPNDAYTDMLQLYIKQLYDMSLIPNILKESFPLTNYAGIYSNERVAKKRLVEGTRIPNYYPANV